MPKAFIKIDRSTTTAIYASDLLQLTRTLRDVMTLTTKIRSLMDNMQAAPDYSDIEANFGIPAGQGQTVYTFVAEIEQALTGAGRKTDAGQQLITRVG